MTLPKLGNLDGALSLLLLAGTLLAQSRTGDTSKPNNLIVYGEGFAFAVREPDGWHGDTGVLARKYQVNVVFVPTHDNPKDITIRVRLNQKVDENTVEDLSYDMAQYKKEYPLAEFTQLKVRHTSYKTFAKLVFVPKRFYEYVAYVNPGPDVKMNFSVALSKAEVPASEAELKAFEDVLQSLRWLTNSIEQRR